MWQNGRNLKFLAYICNSDAKTTNKMNVKIKEDRKMMKMNIEMNQMNQVKLLSRLKLTKWAFALSLLLCGAMPSAAQDTYSVKVNQDTIALVLNKPVEHHYDAKTHVARLTKFVDAIAACDTLSKAQKTEITDTYKAFLAEHRAVRDKLSDEDIRKCSKQKVRYQKAMARIFVNNASDDVSDTAEGVGKSVSKFFKKTGKKIQGAIDGFKDN